MKTNKEIRITTIIGKGSECNGDFSAQGSVRVDGSILGNVNVSETLIIGASGCVNGDISAQTVIIGGEVVGNVHVTERTELTSTARLLGDITTTLIVIDEHAVFQGRCDMNQDVSSKRSKPNPRALRAGKKSAKAAIEEALREVEASDKNDALAENDSIAVGQDIL